MEATHFIEVYKINGRLMGQSAEPYPIQILENIVNFASSVETIAVWRIKKADTPIQDRLRSRGISLKPYYNSIWEQRIEAIKNADTKL